MANTFLRKTSRSIGTSPVTIGSYTVGASTTAIVIGLTVANVSGSEVSVDIIHNDGTNNTYLLKGGSIPVGNSTVIIGGDQKLVLQASDKINVVSNAPSSVDAIMSVLELT